VSPADPPTFIGVAALLMSVALAACWVPAARAVAVDPASVLRAD
jgi:ABC-type lipoprotein release transport system permease subunit